MEPDDVDNPDLQARIASFSLQDYADGALGRIATDLQCGYEVETPKRSSRSVLYKAGIILAPKSSNLSEDEQSSRDKRKESDSLARWFATSTSNATAHLALHGIISSKTQNMLKKRKFGSYSNATRSELFCRDPGRWVELQLARWAADAMLPFSAFQRQDIVDVISSIPGAEDLCGANGFDVRKPLVELYVQTKKAVMDAIDAARASARGLPFININLDLYTSPVQGKKYAALRVNFVLDGELRGVNIGMRRYSPSILVQNKTKASEVLAAFTRVSLEEFGVDVEKHVFSCTSDFGPDVRAAIGTYLPHLNREWCVSHLLHLCLVDAFGGALHRKSSKNVAAREVFDKVRSAIESISKSPLKTKELEDLAKLAETVDGNTGTGRCVKLKNFPVHRWGAAEGTLKGLLRQWDAVVSLVPGLASLKKTVVEFYSVLRQVRAVQVVVQRTRSPSIFVAYLQLHFLYNCMSLTTPLEIRDPSLSATEHLPSQSAPVQRAVENLEPETLFALKQFRTGLQERFFDRYNPFKALSKPTQVFGKRAKLHPDNVQLSDMRFDYGFDFAALLVPHNAFRSRFLDSAIDMCEISEEQLSDLHETLTAVSARLFLKRTLRRLLITKLIDLTEVVVRQGTNQSAIQEPIDAEAPPSPPGEGHMQMFREMFFQSKSDGNGKRTRDAQPPSHRQKARDEVRRFLAVEIDSARELFNNPCPIVMNWWRTTGRTGFPHIATVFRCVAAPFLASSGGLECDLGSMKDVIQPKRTSLGPGMVEVCMFLKLNRSFTNLLAAKAYLSTKDRKEAMPKEFDGEAFFKDDAAPVDTDDCLPEDDLEVASSSSVASSAPTEAPGQAPAEAPAVRAISDWSAWARLHEDLSNVVDMLV